jgi:hypothetical protein
MELAILSTFSLVFSLMFGFPFNALDTVAAVILSSLAMS